MRLHFVFLRIFPAVMLLFSIQSTAHAEMFDQDRYRDSLSAPFDYVLPGTQRRLIRTPSGFTMEVDYERDIITVQGREIPIVIDDADPQLDDAITHDFLTGRPIASPTTYVQISYPRYNAFVETNFYTTYQTQLDNYLNELHERVLLLEQQTGWSSEEFYGVKMSLYVEPILSGCWGGWAIPGEAHLFLSDPFYKTNCKRDYYIGGIPQQGNPGELGDYWIYSAGGLHEALHTINPLPVLGRDWLTEGFSQYAMYNILVEKGDINQETADKYLFDGIADSGHIWNNYIANNYRDFSNFEIQLSSGYSITAWMFSMMRDNYNLDWNKFYALVESNEETLNKADAQSNWEHSDDRVVIDLFGMTLGHTDFDNQTRPIWRYDGPSGPGWGVRQWVSNDFYGDMSVSFNPSDSVLNVGQLLPMTVRNLGQTSLLNVRAHALANLTNSLDVTQNFAAGSVTVLQVPLPLTPGTYTVIAAVDEDNVKIEFSEANNEAQIVVRVTACIDSDADGFGNPGHPLNQCVTDNCPSIFNPSQTDSNNDGIGDACCCVGATGNIDCDLVGSVDIADLTLLVDHLFLSFSPLCCPMEGNTDGNPGVDIGDLTALVDNLFVSFAPLSPCP